MSSSKSSIRISIARKAKIKPLGWLDVQGFWSTARNVGCRFVVRIAYLTVKLIPAAAEEMNNGNGNCIGLQE